MKNTIGKKHRSGLWLIAFFILPVLLVSVPQTSRAETLDDLKKTIVVHSVQRALSLCLIRTSW